MLELFLEFILDLLLFRWIWGDDDDRGSIWKIILVLVVVVCLVGALGFLLKWW